MKYDAEADWYLIKTCNFRCSYCFFPENFLSSKMRIYGTPMEWLEGFNSTGRTWLLNITGGEPSLYPDFVELCEKLTQQHYVSIHTNLTHHCLEDFVQKINPSRIHFIHVAVHFEERKKRGLLETFIKRVHKLQKAKFRVLLSQVMTPQMVHNFLKISEHLEAQGLFIIPKVLRSTYEGKCYPSSYSMEQKKLISEFITRATVKYEPLIKTMSEPPTLYVGNQILFNRVNDYRGLLCSAGSKFVSIDANGTVYRCGPSEIYGNILLRNVNLLDGTKPCDTSYCPSVCIKYSIQDKISPAKIYFQFKRNIVKANDVLRNDGFACLFNKVSFKVKNSLYKYLKY